MANISNIQVLAKKLNLQNMAKPEFGLCETDMSNLDFLEFVLQKELQIRYDKLIIRRLRESKLSKREPDFNKLNEGAKWQIDELLKKEFSDENNLVIMGGCRTDKTALAGYLGTEAVKSGLKAYYTKQDLLLDVLKGKTVEPKCKGIWNRLKGADVIVLDEVLYTDLSVEEINLLYKGLIFLNETRKLIFVTNRSPAEWLSASTDKHLMQTFIDRLLSDAEILRTNRQ